MTKYALTVLFDDILSLLYEATECRENTNLATLYGCRGDGKVL